MKILFYSPNFLPKTGGLENMVAMLAQEFSNDGIELKLITHTPTSEVDVLPYKVYRNPTFRTVLKLMKWCDIFFQHNVSLKGLWPFLFYKRKFVIAHHTSHYRLDGKLTVTGILKQFLTKYALNICCSSYIASLIPGRSIVVPNCYNSEIFKNIGLARSYELIFVGRLVSDKGIGIVLEALAKLRREKISLKFSIVGSGPEESALRKLVDIYNLEDQVFFLGIKKNRELVEILNRHQIMIVPSICQEAFGIVALEGLACGCKMIVSDVGGLPEAIGGNGLIFKPGSSADLAVKIKTSLNTETILNIQPYLEKHSIKKVAHSYLAAIKNHFFQIQK